MLQAQEQEEFYSDLCAKLEEERDASELQLAREKEARIASDNARRKTELVMEGMIKEIQKIKAAEHRRREMVRLLTAMPESKIMCERGETMHVVVYNCCSFQKELLLSTWAVFTNVNDLNE